MVICVEIALSLFDKVGQTRSPTEALRSANVQTEFLPPFIFCALAINCLCDLIRPHIQAPSLVFISREHRQWVNLHHATIGIDHVRGYLLLWHVELLLLHVGEVL